MQQDGQLSCHGNNGPFLPALAAALGQLQTPAPQIAVGSKRPQDMVRSLYQQGSQIGIAFLADVHLRLALARVSSSRLQTQVAAHIPALTKSMRVFQRQQEGQRDQCAHPLHLLQLCHFGIAFPRQSLDPFIAFPNAFTQRLDSRQQRLQCGSQFRTQPLGLLRIHIAYVAPAQPLAIALGQSAGRVHQRRSCAHQPGSRPDHGQIRLRLRAAMFHRRQQLRIDPGQPRQGLRIDPIILLSASPINRTLRAWATITSCPNWLNNRLTQGECIPVSNAIRLRGTAPNTSFMAFGVVPSFCSRTIAPASSSTQHQLERSPRSSPIVSFCSDIFLLCCVATVLIFFIAGLLFICASSTSITWERTASRPETGLLIPSDYNSYAGNVPSRNPWCPMAL